MAGVPLTGIRLKGTGTGITNIIGIILDGTMTIYGTIIRKGSHSRVIGLAKICAVLDAYYKMILTLPSSCSMPEVI